MTGECSSQTSPRFNSATADVVFLSSDGVEFHVHRKNLESTTGAFPGPEISTFGEVVPLTESAETLEVLFQYSYPQRHPELEEMKFETVVLLAEAVEKYEVFPAMQACHRIMKIYMSQRPAEVLAYAGKHGYKNLADEAAPRLITKPLDEMVKFLPPGLVIPWVLYSEEWNKVLRAAYAQPNVNLTGHGICGAWASLAIPISLRLSGQVGSLRDVKEIFAAHVPPAFNFCCSRSLTAWQQSIEENVQKIPKFSTFL
ncbi:hypothetical protein BDN72DRAFT_826721 [Pluteus cervinus]|uniref:Uncharacterized protein n=1 Tax=Pluteus cervinus TaxID=181527 RepID=A0ACD3ABM8_9AGAR|nr:hypothetical protein BDN72DRAFT_826721 [Pluteus cervinus]